MSDIRRDVISAYVAAASRLASWVVVTAIVYRRLGIEYFAVLALVRTTIGLLNYTTLGLVPATIRLLAVEPKTGAGASAVYSSAVALAIISGLVATIIAIAYSVFFGSIHVLPAALAHTDLRPFVRAMGIGTVMRLASDPFGAALQVRGRIVQDNLIASAGELIWMFLCLAFLWRSHDLNFVGYSWCFSGLFVLSARMIRAQMQMGSRAFSVRAIQIATVGSLLTFGLLVALAQAADFLYAPTDNILINRFINPETVAVYAPAIQIDAGLLLLVSGLSAVLLPHGALAHAQGDNRRLRRFYFLGTLLSLLLLLPAASVIWLIAPQLFRAWLHDSVPATVAILPMVLIHTVIGGSSGVGRSILLAIGKVRPFTCAVLIAGSANVLLSFVFVRYCGLGLRGIVLGTIIAVVGRCAIWTPWYVIKSLPR